jgi:Holliday junction resolvase RusA-like endonuclease
MRSATFTLPLPPSVNGLYANVAGRGRVSTKALRRWRKAAYAEIAVQAHGQKIAGAFRVTILASDHELPSRRDADGLAKAVIDALVHTDVVPDDSWKFMRGLSVDWTPNLPARTCSVSIEELSPEPLKAPALKRRQKAKGIPASILAALKAKGIKIDPGRIHVQ